MFELICVTPQTDLFGVAGTVHVVLHGSYMKVYQEQGQWKTTGSLNRWDIATLSVSKYVMSF